MFQFGVRQVVPGLFVCINWSIERNWVGKHRTKPTFPVYLFNTQTSVAQLSIQMEYYPDFCHIFCKAVIINKVITHPLQ